MLNIQTVQFYQQAVRSIAVELTNLKQQT